MTVVRTTEVQGLQVKIDRPKGFVQEGKDEEGHSWKRVYRYDYGFLPKTEGGDNEHLDVFVGPYKDAEMAYLVTQKKKDGSFDEYKLFLQFPNLAAAKTAYLAHIPKRFFAGIDMIPIGFVRGILGKEPDVTKTAVDMLLREIWGNSDLDATSS